MLRELGRVKAIFRYPVKSMAGEFLNSASLGWGGIEGDRRLAFRRENDTSGFPWLTAGKLPELILYRPVRPEGSAESELPAYVETPAGETLELSGETLRLELSARHGTEVRLMHMKQGVFDEAPVSLISTATIAALEASTGRPLDIRRFRPNFVIETREDIAFAEDEWIGKAVRFGPESTATVAVTMQDIRCGMINLEPGTAVVDPAVLRSVVRTHGNCAGVYGTTFRRGTVSLGDVVYMAEGY